MTSPASSGRSTASDSRGDERFDTDVFRESVDGIMNVNAFLRWAAVNMLLGSWGQLLCDSVKLLPLQLGSQGSGEGFRQLSLFPLHPLGLRQLSGNRLLWYAMAVRRYPRLAGQGEPSHPEDPARTESAPQPRLPSVLRGLFGALLDTEFNPGAIAAQIEHALKTACGTASNRQPIWNPMHLDGQPFTGRRYSNDEIYQGLPAAPAPAWEEDDRGIVHTFVCVTTAPARNWNS